MSSDVTPLQQRQLHPDDRQAAHPAAGPAASFGHCRGERVAPPCARGEHNRTVLAELGYGEDEIDAFESRGVVAPQH
jgi:crotonobetainyl-CoA:carnitine CoA-transferase CaiB-like acyl-CoA transferase